MPDLIVERLMAEHAGRFYLRDPEPENLAGKETGRKTLSHSTLNLWLACPQKFGWAKVERLEPVAERRALSLGKALHYGVEMNDPQAGLEFFIENSAAPENQHEQERIEQDAMIVASATGAYLSRYEPPENEQREVEYVVRIRNPWTGHYSKTYDLHGYADGVVDNGDHLELIERKFVGQISDLSRRKLYLDRQVSLACYALWRATGKPVKVVRYRYVRKPSIRQGKAESHKDFLARVESDYKARPDFYVPEFEPIYRDYRDLLRTEAELWKWATEIREGIQDGFFTRNTGHCSDFGGCEFMPLCMAEPGADSLYRVRETYVPTPEEGES